MNLPEALQSTDSLQSPRPAEGIHGGAAAPQQRGTPERRHGFLSAASCSQPDVLPTTGDQQAALPLLGLPDQCLTLSTPPSPPLKRHSVQTTRESTAAFFCLFFTIRTFTGLL